MPRFDPSPWNLGLPIGALATACGPVLPLEPMGPTSLGETDPTLATGDDEGTTSTSPCTPACTPGYVCEYGACVPDGGCFEFGCCYEGPCCGEGPCDDGGYGCYGLGECNSAFFCEMYQCLPIDVPPDCITPFVVAEVLGPTPTEIGTIFALAFMQTDGEAGRALVVGHDFGAAIVPGPQEPAVALPLPYGLVSSIAVGDLDADGDEDLALEVTQSRAQLIVMRNDAADPLAFTAIVSGSQTVYDVHAGDLDGDGLPDLVGGLDLGLGYFVLGMLPNAGGLMFGAPTLLDVNSPPLDLDVGDLDGNGLADVAAVGNVFQQVWYGSADTTMIGAPDLALQDAQGYVTQLVVDDFDGNGVDELVRLTALNGTTLVDAWTLAQGALVEAPEWGWPGAPVLSDAGDVNGDGLADLLSASGKAVHVRFGAATAELFGCSSRIDLPIDVYSLAVGDFTGDGAEDIAVSNGSSVQVYAVAAPPPR